MNNIVSVILARKNSKGIPNKNITSLLGKPLVFYTINASVQLGIPTYISSDCDNILNIAEQFGAIPFKRTACYATDLSPSEDALIEVCNTFKKNYTVVFIQPTSPLLQSYHLLEGLQLYNSFDSVFSAYKHHWLPTWGLDRVPVDWQIDKRPMRQQKPSVFVENGAFYINSCNNIKKSRLRYSGNIGIYEMSIEDSFQVDTIDDLKLIEKIMYGKNKKIM